MTPQPAYLPLAFNLRRLRTQLGLTMLEVAEEVGVSVDQIQKWELAQREPRLKNLVKLARAFDVSTDDLLGVSASVGANL